VISQLPQTPNVGPEVPTSLWKWLVEMGNRIRQLIERVNTTVPTGPGDMLKALYDTNDDGKVNCAHVADSVPWAGVGGKPATFPPAAHKANHAAGGGDALTAADIGAAASNHSHTGVYEPADSGIQIHIASTGDPHGTLPSQAGNGGKFLATDGSSASWQALPAIPTGIAFCLTNPAADAESARYILRADKTAAEVKAVSTTAPTAAITVKVFRNATEIASFDHSTTLTTHDISPDVDLSTDDVLYAKIDGAVNGVTNITIELTVVDR